jgi:hypothetical protein
MTNGNLQFFLGIVVGIFTNLISWWILFHLLVPKIRFSSQISKASKEKESFDQTKYRYRMKFENAGRRLLIDVEITAHIHIYGIGPHKETTWHLLLLPLSPDGSLEC